MDICPSDTSHIGSDFNGSDGENRTLGPGFYDLGRELCDDDESIKSVPKSTGERSQNTGTIPIVARSDEDGDDIVAYVLNGFPATR